MSTNHSNKLNALLEKARNAQRVKIYGKEDFLNALADFLSANYKSVNYLSFFKFSIVITENQDTPNIVLFSTETESYIKSFEIDFSLFTDLTANDILNIFNNEYHTEISDFENYHKYSIYYKENVFCKIITLYFE